MAKLRAVLDTNVLIMAVVGHGLCFKLLDAAYRKEYHQCTSREILEEVAELLARPKCGLRSRQIRGAVLKIVAASQVVEARRRPASWQMIRMT